MKEFTLLGVAIIGSFIVFVIYWNNKWRGKRLDEREAMIRLKIREMISRAIEITLVLSIVFHFLVRPLTGLEALILIGLAGIIAEVFGNWFLRKDDSVTVE